MNLTFGICWIEDQADEMQRNSIEEAIRNSGFEPDVHPVENENQIEEFARKQENFYDYDLILLDLNLAGGWLGSKLAREVRRNFKATPILFYSTEDEQVLRQMMVDEKIEGVFCAHRERLSERVEEIVSNLAPSFNRLSGIRGLAARVVAECDQEFRTILSHFGENLGYKDRIIDSINSLIMENSEQQKEDISEIQTLDELLNCRWTSSQILFRTVRRLIRNDGDNPHTDEIRTIRGDIRKYSEKVLKVRNTLAHAIEERIDDRWRILQRGNPPSYLEIQDLKGFREDFLEYLKNIRRLREILVP